MDFSTVLARLNDLPNTFKRDGAPYTQNIDAIALGLATFTQAADATSQQTQNFMNAVDAWLDVWGLLWGVPRIANEANSVFSVRIARTILAWVGTVPAIQRWLNFYAPGGTITENSSGLGYLITLSGSMTTAQATQFLISLNRIRPAGVPFVVNLTGGGLFLGTTEFLGDGNIAGSYLAGGTTSFPLPGASQGNATPLLPTLLFDDPTLNPASN